MATHTTETSPLYAATILQAIVSAIIVMLIFALVLFFLFTPRHAYGGFEVFSASAGIATPAAIDGLLGIVFAAMTAGALLWLYMRDLAH